MYNTKQSISIYVNEVKKQFIISRLVPLLSLCILGGALFSSLDFLEGRVLGQPLFVLFILSEIPILLNYFFLVLTRFGIRKESLMTFFSCYYARGLFLHSILYSLVLGLAFAHALLVLPQSIFCLILLGFLMLLWILEYFLWHFNWPLYIEGNMRAYFLYWTHWLVLFGLLIGLPFHAHAWSIFWVATFSTLAFIPLFAFILIDIRKMKFLVVKQSILESNGSIPNSKEVS